jgi:hypothetical protein
VEFERNVIVDELTYYLLGGQSFFDFWMWLCRESVDIHKWGSPELCDLVYEIKLLVAEYTSGDRPKESLDAEFMRIVEEGV